MLNFPHTRGDEPYVDAEELAVIVIFPTRVGMNRRESLQDRHQYHFPHTRGDEPVSGVPPSPSFSNFPHTRGDEPMGG